MPRLTKRAIDAIEAAPKDFFLWDEELKGFGVRVLPSGQKTFLVQYKAAGRTRRVKLGRFGPLTADDARKLAKTTLGNVAKGEDPAAAIAADRASPTIEEVCDRFLESHVKKRLKLSTQKHYEWTLETHVKPIWGKRKIADIDSSDAVKLHEGLSDRPYQANRTIAVLSKMFKLTEAWRLRPKGSNPCKEVERYKEHWRKRYLTAAELRRLFKVLEGWDNQYAASAIRLLILTGCRLGEIQTLKWDYIDDGYIRLPDSKTGARNIQLTDEVRDVLSRVKRLNSNPYVIVGAEFGEHYKNLQSAWRKIRTKAGLEDVRIHDLRHTYASHAIAGGEELPMVKELMGHKNINTTMGYVHLMDENVCGARKNLSARLGKLMTTAEGLSQSPLVATIAMTNGQTVGADAIVVFSTPRSAKKPL
jgi:integrase